MEVSLDDPQKYKGLIGLISHMGKIPLVHPNFRLALCGYNTKMTCFAVLDKNTNLIYSTTHTWCDTGCKFVRFITSQREDVYTALFDRSQIDNSDIVTSTHYGYAPNRIPIMAPLRNIGKWNIGSREDRETLHLTSLLDGSNHQVTKHITINGRTGVEIDTTSYPGHSGLGFVDESGALYLLSGGRGNNFERTILTKATI